MLKFSELIPFVQVFERETNREKNLEKAAKEAKVKARKEAAKTSDNDKDRALDEQDILKVCFTLKYSKVACIPGNLLILCVVFVCIYICPIFHTVMLFYSALVL